MPVRILVVDDHEVLRMGIRMVCAAHPDWQICDEASDGEEAIRKIPDCKPDLVILDLSLPGVMNGFDVAGVIREIAPGVRIILYSLHEVAFTARQAGADLFVAKSAGAVGLAAAIERAMAQPPSEAARQEEIDRIGPLKFFRESRG